MSVVDLAVSRLRVAEGFRAHVYRDTVGKQTIGYGFNVDSGISEYAAEALLVAQTEERETELKEYWWAVGLDDVRMSVIVEIAFNSGISSLLHFPKMLAAVGAKDWETAKAELLDSDAARQLPGRYAKLAEIMLTGAV
jgi:lysozyme